MLRSRHEPHVLPRDARGKRPELCLLCSKPVDPPTTGRPFSERPRRAHVDLAVAPNTGEQQVIDEERYLMPVLSRPPLVMSHGHGSWLVDETGRQYLDFVQGWAVNTLGHAPPELAQVLTHQATRLLSASPAYLTRPLLQLVERLCQLTGMDRAFIANSGAEANDAAIKLARKWAQKHRPGAYKVITTRGGFHGRTLACVAASGKTGWDEAFPPMLEGFVKVPFGDAGAVEAALDTDVCAVMVEPIQGEAGVILPPRGYLQALRQLADAHGVLLIVDEIQTGICRTGPLLRSQEEGVRPDILTLGKGLGGGVPVAALLCTERANAFDQGDHGGTYAGNPFVAVAASRVLDIVGTTEFQRGVVGAGQRLESALHGLSEAHPGLIRNIRGAGLLWACDLREPVAPEVRDTALEEAALLINAPGPHTLRFMPQLRVCDEEVDEFARRMNTCLAPFSRSYRTGALERTRR